MLTSRVDQGRTAHARYVHERYTPWPTSFMHTNTYPARCGRVQRRPIHSLAQSSRTQATECKSLVTPSATIRHRIGPSPPFTRFPPPTPCPQVACKTASHEHLLALQARCEAIRNGPPPPRNAMHSLPCTHFPPESARASQAAWRLGRRRLMAPPAA